MKKILVMGLPGSGKTYFADKLKAYLESNSEYFSPAFELATSRATVKRLNADEIRTKYNDWDFSHEGRVRQSIRMRELADSLLKDFVISDFVAPLPEMRHNFKADWTVWMDTIEQGRFEDTNKMFVPPDVYDFRIAGVTYGRRRANSQTRGATSRSNASFTRDS
jgi:adenylylsulfate kinase